MSEIEQIIIKLRENKPALKNNYGVKALGVFGSYLKNAQKKGSDVDILVEFEEPISLLKYLALEQQLSKLMGKKVDLVMKSALKPRIGEEILKEVIYV